VIYIKGAFAEFERSLVKERKGKASPCPSSAVPLQGAEKTFIQEPELTQRGGSGCPK
jgi:hypothetical protein